MTQELLEIPGLPDQREPRATRDRLVLTEPLVPLDRQRCLKMRTTRPRSARTGLSIRHSAAALLDRRGRRDLPERQEPRDRLGLTAPLGPRVTRGRREPRDRLVPRDRLGLTEQAVLRVIPDQRGLTVQRVHRVLIQPCPVPREPRVTRGRLDPLEPRVTRASLVKLVQRGRRVLRVQRAHQAWVSSSRVRWTRRASFHLAATRLVTYGLYRHRNPHTAGFGMAPSGLTQVQSRVLPGQLGLPEPRVTRGLPVLLAQLELLELLARRVTRGRLDPPERIPL